MNSPGMNRREALRALTVAGAGAASLPLWVESLCQVAQAHTEAFGQESPGAAAGWTPTVFTTEQNETVVTLTELIIPQTDTTGAKAAYVNRFIDTVLADAPQAERDSFLNGLAWLDRRSQELFGAAFNDATPGQQNALLTVLGSEHNDTLADQVGVELFQAVKTLTVTGYYTSRVGMREELDDDGRRYFDDKPGCLHLEHKA